MFHTIACSSKLTNDAGEFAAIESVIVKIWLYTERKLLENQQISIFTNSLYALKALNCSIGVSGQFLVGSIFCLNHLICTSTQNIDINF